MLGLNQPSLISSKMITTADYLTGYEITEMAGPVWGFAEKGFATVSIHGLGATQGGQLEELLTIAEENLISSATGRGANAVIGFRFATIGRDLEKSVVAYGTAVKCRKMQS